MPLSSPIGQEERGLFYHEFEDVVRIIATNHFAPVKTG